MFSSSLDPLFLSWIGRVCPRRIHTCSPTRSLMLPICLYIQRYKLTTGLCNQVGFLVKEITAGLTAGFFSVTVVVHFLLVTSCHNVILVLVILRLTLSVLWSLAECFSVMTKTSTPCCWLHVLCMWYCVAQIQAPSCTADMTLRQLWNKFWKCI